MLDARSILRVTAVTLPGAGLCCQNPTSKPAGKPATKATDATARGNQLLGILQRLKSYDRAQVAWGGYLAAKQGYKQLIPDLRRTLHGLMEHKGGTLVAMALLDALIQLKADVPARELEPWLSGHTLAASMVLMARNPKNYEDLLLDLYDIQRKDTWNSRYWLAAGNLLVSIQSKKIAARILKGLHVSLAVNLYDTGSDMSQNFSIGLGGGGGYGSSRRRLRIPKNYPPVPLYRLEKQSHKKASLLAPGPKPIYYRRQLSPRYRLRSTYSFENISRRKLEWICALLGIQVDKQPFQLWDGARITWKDADAYVRKIETERKKVEGSFKSLINRLQAKGLVSKEDVEDVNPAVSIQVFDHRQKDPTPLPEIEAVKVQRVEKKAPEEKEGQKKK
ncbi:MAG: hypothetical protein V3U11_11515 [Planctomycetota bacterium]